MNSTPHHGTRLARVCSTNSKLFCYIGILRNSRKVSLLISFILHSDTHNKYINFNQDIINYSLSGCVRFTTCNHRTQMFNLLQYCPIAFLWLSHFIPISDLVIILQYANMLYYFIYRFNSLNIISASSVLKLPNHLRRGYCRLYH